MCGRYTLFTEEENQELREIIEAAEKQAGPEELKLGEIFPTNKAPILIQDKGHMIPQAVTWGYPGFQGSKVIINARAETAEEKNMFRKSLYQRRCAVPTTGFYEWDQSKCKFRFVLAETPVVYLAGLYNDFDGERRFLILTTAANDSVSPIHHRMPVILYRETLEDWLTRLDIAVEMLYAPQPPLQMVTA